MVVGEVHVVLLSTRKIRARPTRIDTSPSKRRRASLEHVSTSRLNVDSLFVRQPLTVSPLVLRKHDKENDTTRKQKFIGTRKCDPEASTSHSNATKDLEGSTKDAASRNTQRTKYSKNINGHERCKDDHNKQRGDRSDVVEPRSYRDVVVNGNTSVMT